MDWYPHHIKDYDADTISLTVEQDGMYCRLIRWYYQHERPLPPDDETLAKICRVNIQTWRKHSKALMPLFQPNGDGRLHHKRCDLELAEAERRRKLAVERQRKGRESRHAGVTRD